MIERPRLTILQRLTPRSLLKAIFWLARAAFLRSRCYLMMKMKSQLCDLTVDVATHMSKLKGVALTRYGRWWWENRTKVVEERTTSPKNKTALHMLQFKRPKQNIDLTLYCFFQTATAMTGWKRVSRLHWDTLVSRPSPPTIAGQPMRRRPSHWSWSGAGPSSRRGKGRSPPRMRRLRASTQLETLWVCWRKRAACSNQESCWDTSIPSSPVVRPPCCGTSRFGAGLYFLEMDGSQWVESVSSLMPVKVWPAKGKTNCYRLCTSLCTIHKAVHHSRPCWAWKTVAISIKRLSSMAAEELTVALAPQEFSIPYMLFISVFWTCLFVTIFGGCRYWD